MINPEHEGSCQQRILVVDDDENSLFVTSLLLSEAGYLVDDAADGEEAWEALLSTRYDLLFTDHNMPRLCGLDLIMRVRAAGMKIPVVLYSGSPGLGDGPDYSHLALTAVLQKSTNFAEVQHVVQRILSPPCKDSPSRQGEFRPAPHSPPIDRWGPTRYSSATQTTPSQPVLLAKQ